MYLLTILLFHLRVPTYDSEIKSSAHFYCSSGERQLHPLLLAGLHQQPDSNQQHRHHETPWPIHMPAPIFIMQTRRRVTFSNDSEMILVLNLAQTDRRHFLWFTPDELRSFKSNVHICVNVARKLISERQIPSADVIIGLEKHLSLQLTAEYRARRSKLYNVVLGEDAWHRSPDCAGVPQDEMITRLARISADNTKWAMERALAAAMYLEQDQVTEQRLQEQQQKQTTQQAKDLSHSVPRQEQSWQTNRRSSLQETKRCRIVDTPESPLEDEASYPRLLRAVSPSNSIC